MRAEDSRLAMTELSRRSFLSGSLVVGAAGLGLSLDQWLRLRSANAEQKHYESKEGPCKSVINIFLPGGLAHQDSFDPKPYAPIDYRGAIRSIGTKIPGERFSELLPKTAKIADRLTIVRSMTHGEAAHERGTHNMFTGYRPSPALVFPSMGSIVSHEFGPRKNLPPYVCVPQLPNTYAGSGYLSSAYAPFSLGSDPARGNFKVRDLSLPGSVTSKRFSRRRSMLDVVNEHFRETEESDSLDAMDTFYKRAYAMISSPEARDAFRIEAESKAVRDSYGQNQAGQRFLLARRLVEAGVRFVSLTYGGWDMHNNIRASMRRQMPPFDQAYSRLILDLEERGLLDSTLVMVTTEFGRTPKINGNAGRDHWPKVFSIALAGGGFKKGFIYGKSDATATEPEEDAIGVEDWATTVYHQLGIVADKELMAPGDRPVEIVDGGKVRKGLLA
ncbi:MAG: DUF1501 domain-containing protein [Planctomycetota bacterium]